MDLPIKLQNEGKRIKVTLKKLKDSYSILLVYQIMLNGKRYSKTKAIKKRVYLKSTTRQKDVETLRLAMTIRDEFEKNSKTKKIDLFAVTTKNSETDLITYMTNLSESYKGNTYKTWVKAIKHCKTFFGNQFLISELSRSKSRKFSEYLLNNLKRNSANTYFQKYKQTIKRAIDDEIILIDYASNVIISKEKTNIEFLSLEEIKIVENTPINDINIKNAFLFSCFTGIRIGDLQAIKFSNIVGDHIKFKMQKTKDFIDMKLHPKAKEIIAFQKLLKHPFENDYIFQLKTYETSRKKIKRFMKRTGIKKKITFHCARHTFATICITFDVPIYTLSKLLGHKDVKTTQVYAKLIDKKKDEAIDKLPNF